MIKYRKLKKEEVAVQKQDNNKNEKRKILIAATIAAAVIVLALIPIIITLVTKGDSPTNNPNTGKTLEGTYSMSTASGTYSGSSSYTFDGNKVTNTYFDGEDTVTVEYTYVIAIENDIEVIKLTPATEENAKAQSYEFYTGTQEIDGALREFLSINETFYYKQ